MAHKNYKHLYMHVRFEADKNSKDWDKAPKNYK